MKKEVFEQARSHIVEASRALRAKRVDDLRSLTAKQEKQSLKFGGQDFEVCAWAREHGFKRLRLWAPSENAAALALYRHAGFKDTGRRRPLPTNAGLQIVELEYEQMQ